MKPFAAVLAATVLLFAVPAGTLAQTGAQPAPNDSETSPSERLQEGAAAIVEGLRLLMDQLQSYQPPEILPNGDVIIRRRSPGQPAPDEPNRAPETPKPGSDKPLPL